MPFLDWSDAEGLYGLLRDLNESIEAELADDPVVEHLVACRDEVERITEPGPIDAEASTRRAETSAEQLQRQALLKMPVEARRRVLAAQARLAARHYETDPDWKETLDGDLDDGE